MDIRKYVGYAVHLMMLSMSHLLKPLESGLAFKFGEKGIEKYPPVFIIGAPRCGSTLLYKILTERFEFTYFNNFTARFFEVPICGMFLNRLLGIKSLAGNYSFDYGNMQGLGAPNECGEFWYRWFSRPPHVYVEPGTTPAKKLNHIRWEIGGMEAVTRRPILFKNLYNSMRIAPIAKAIPNALFLVMRRDMGDTALSILKGRMRNNHSREEWWSLPPKEFSSLKNCRWDEQITGQVVHIYRQIEADRNRFGEERFFDVSYEEFCMDVHSVVGKIEQFFHGHGLNIRGHGDIPKRFPIMGVNGIVADDRVQLLETIDTMQLGPKK